MRAWNGPRQSRTTSGRIVIACWHNLAKAKRRLSRGTGVMSPRYDVGETARAGGGARRRGNGEWALTNSPRKRAEPEAADDRILGSSEFVERVLKEADVRVARQAGLKRIKRQVERVVVESCKKSSVSVTELRSGIRRGMIPPSRNGWSRITEWRRRRRRDKLAFRFRECQKC